MISMETNPMTQEILVFSVL
jgi:exportin-1